jgi:hypothetical protein
MKKANKKSDIEKSQPGLDSKSLVEVEETTETQESEKLSSPRRRSDRKMKPRQARG